MNIDFFYYIDKRSLATHVSIMNIQSIFPSSKIFINDYVYDKETYSCIYSKKNKIVTEKYFSLTVDGLIKYMNFLDDCIRSSSADWMMIMEPDVFIAKAPERFPDADACGILRNTVPKNPYNRLKYGLVPNVGKRFSMAGGSIINVSSWKSKYNGMSRELWEGLYEAWYEVKALDVLTSVMLWYYGMSISEWDELAEVNVGTRIYKCSVFHGVKSFYNGWETVSSKEGT